MSIPIPPNPTDPIPNDPFFFPETNTIIGTLGPLIVGSSLNISVDGTINAVGGGPAVTYLTGGPGINVSANTGNVNLYNTGVLSVSAGSGISVTGSQGNLTITNTAPAFNVGGTVTQVNTGDGLTGGPITTSGTIALSNTGVGAATYVNPTITVDAKGRITAATPGTAIQSISGTLPIVVTGTNNAIISVNNASPTVAGVVRVSDSIACASSTIAASSQAVKSAYDLAQAALPCSVLTSQGDLISSNSIGTPIRVPAGAEGTYLKVCAACTGTGGLTWGSPGGGGGGTVTSVTAGTGLTGGTITASGTIALDTACVIAPSVLTGQGALITASSSGNPVTLGAGTNGQVLTANSLCTPGLEWITPIASVPCSAFNVKGDLLIGTGPASYAALPVGGNGEILTACSTCTSGVAWVANSSNAMPTTGGTFTGNVTFSGGVPGGTILTLGTLVPGDGYDFGVYSNVTLTGGTGVGATADIGVGFDGGVADVTLVNPGTGYTVGDSLTAFSTFGTPWSILVDTVTAGVPGATIIDGVGSCGTAGQVLTSNGANAICWETLTVPSAAAPFTRGTVYGVNDDVCFNTSIGEGSYSSYEVATGERNTFVGAYGGASQLTLASCNSGVGQGIFGSLTSGCNNTAMGDSDTLGFLTTGCGNSAFGSIALQGVITGSSNVGIGNCAGCRITTGSRNVAIGPGVQVASNTGNCQLAIGFSDTANWITGDSTKAIKPGAGIIDCANSCGIAGQVLASNGSNALCWRSLPSPPGAATPDALGLVYGFTDDNFGGPNTGLGYWSMGCVDNLTTGISNVAVGGFAGYWLSSGSNNIAVGNTALYSGAAAAENHNIAIGSAAQANAGGSNNVAIGSSAGCFVGCNNEGGDNNTFLGYNSGICVTSGCCNTLLGNQSGNLLTIGSSNVVIGSGVNVASPAGSCQLAIGFASGQTWLTGTSTKAIKPGAGIIDCAGSCGTAGQVLMSNGANAVCWGTLPTTSQATPTVSGTVVGWAPDSGAGCNAGFGYLAFNARGGVQNTALGVLSMYLTTSGSNNAAVGYQSSATLTSGNCNASVGMCALACVTTGSNNIGIGYSAGASPAGFVNLTTESNRIAMGNSSHTCAQIQIAWSTVSDVRDKAIDPAGVPYGLSFVNQIQPIAYCWCDRTTGVVTEDRKRFGFSAQNICNLETATNTPVIVSADDPEHLMITDQALLPVLVKAIQELSAKVEALESKQSN